MSDAVRHREGTTGPVERILALYRLPAFRELGPANVALMARHVRERRIRKGEVFWRESEPPSALLVIMQGEVGFSSTTEADYTVGPGHAIGAQGLFLRVADGVAATALTPVVALELPVAAMLEIMEDNFEILLHAIRLEAVQLLEAQDRLPAERMVPHRAVDLAWVERPEQLDLVERILLLRQLPEFARASVDAMAEVARNLSQVRYEAGETIWKRGEPSGPMLFILDGVALATRHRPPSTVRYDCGASVGVIYSLAGHARSHTLVAESTVTALACHADVLLDVFEDNFEMAIAFIGALTRQRGLIGQRVGTDTGARLGLKRR